MMLLVVLLFQQPAMVKLAPGAGAPAAAVASAPSKSSSTESDVPTLAPAEHAALKALALSTAWPAKANANDCHLRKLLQQEPACTLIKNCSSCLTSECEEHSRKERPWLPPDQCWACPGGGVQCSDSKHIPTAGRTWQDAIGCEYWDRGLNPNMPNGDVNDGFLHVTHIFLEGCGLTAAPNFTAFPQLLFLGLKQNGLRDFPQAVPSHLNGLFLTANKIQSIHENATAHLVSLGQLYVDDNQLTHVPEGILGTATTGCNLAEIGLSNNLITAIPMEAIASRCADLTRLFLDGNQLVAQALEVEKLNPATQLMKLQTVDFANNGLLGRVPAWVWGLKSLQVLGLANCGLTQFGLNNAIPNITGESKLMQLDLTANRLSILPDNFCQNFRELADLRLSHNLFKALPIGNNGKNHGLEKLQVLDCSNNPLHSTTSKTWVQEIEGILSSNRGSLRLDVTNRELDLGSTILAPYPISCSANDVWADKCSFTVSTFTLTNESAQLIGVSVTYGGLDISVTETVGGSNRKPEVIRATDNLNGNYTVAIPRTWSRKPGYHDVQIFNGSEVIPFSRDTFNSRLYPDHIRIEIEPAKCPAGKYDRTSGVVACFEKDFNGDVVAALKQKWVSDEKAGAAPCEDCTAIQQCVSCATEDSEPKSLPGWALAPRNTPSDFVGGDKFIFRCSNEAACPGSDIHMRNKHFLNQCAGNHTGTLCSDCQAGSFSLDEGDSCEGSCSGTSQALPHGIIVSLVIYALVVPCVLLLSRVCIKRLLFLMKDESMQGVARNVKIVLSYFQVASSMGSVLGIDYHQRVSTWSHAQRFSQVLFFNMKGLGSYLKCLIGERLMYYKIWCFQVFVLPSLLVLVLALPMIWTVIRRRWYAEDRQRAVAAFRHRLTLLVFMIYPHTSHVIVGAFECRLLGPNRRTDSYLEAELSINCHNSFHAAFAAYVALPMTFLVPIGVPLLLLCFFVHRYRRNREDFEQRSHLVIEPNANASLLQYNKDDLDDTIGSITEDYKPDFCYFEIVDWIRKGFFSAGLLLCQRGSIVQLFLAMFASFSFFALQLAVMPMKRFSHNLLKLWEELTIFVTLLVSVLLKTFQIGQERQLNIHRDLIMDGILVTVVVGLFIGCGVNVGLALRKLWMRSAQESFRESFRNSGGNLQGDGSTSASQLRNSASTASSEVPAEGKSCRGQRCWYRVLLICVLLTAAVFAVIIYHSGHNKVPPHRSLPTHKISKWQCSDPSSSTCVQNRAGSFTSRIECENNQRCMTPPPPGSCPAGIPAGFQCFSNGFAFVKAVKKCSGYDVRDGPFLTPPPPPPPPAQCDPNSKPPQRCPGNQPCPQCGHASCDCPAPKPTPPAPPPGPEPEPKPPPPTPVHHCRLALACAQTSPCTISVNESFPGDRMVVKAGMEVIMQDVNLQHNAVTGDDIGGGLLYIAPGGIVAAKRVTFLGGYNAKSSGGAVCLYSSIPTKQFSNFTCTDCNFVGNSAQLGGAVASLGGNLTLIRPTYTGNTMHFKNKPGICKGKAGTDLCPCKGTCGSACYCRRFTDPTKPFGGGGYSCTGCESGPGCKADTTEYCDTIHGLTCSYCND